MIVRYRRLLVLGFVFGLAALSFTLAQHDRVSPRHDPQPDKGTSLNVVIELATNAVECPVEFADAEFFIEVNATDGDAGVQLMLDGEGWNELEMTDPMDNLVLEVDADDGPTGSIGVQGLTEFFFESAEPSFEDQTLQELLDLFPEGEYEFVGRTTEGETVCGIAEFTHNVPGEPEPRVCKDDDGEEATICWEPVENAFEDPNGAEVGDDIEISMYRVVAEALDEEGEGLETLDIELPSSSLCMSLPEEFVALSPVGEFKFEVIATEESGNQTIFEGEFSLDDSEECDDDDDDDDDGDGDGDGDDDDDDDDDDR